MKEKLERKPRLMNIASISDLATCLPGDWLSVKINPCKSTRPRLMIYEGQIDKKEAFAEGDQERKVIASWRISKGYLEFSNNLQGNKGIGTVIFNDLSMGRPIEYTLKDDGAPYLIRLGMLAKAKLWNSTAPEKYMLLQAALHDENFIEARQIGESAMLRGVITPQEIEWIHEGIEKGLRTRGYNTKQ